MFQEIFLFVVTQIYFILFLFFYPSFLVAIFATSIMNIITISSDEEEDCQPFLLSIDPGQLNLGIAIFNTTDDKLVHLENKSLNLLPTEKDVKSIAIKLNQTMVDLFLIYPIKSIKTVLIENQIKTAGGRFNTSCEKNGMIEISLYSIFLLNGIEPISVNSKKGIRFICRKESNYFNYL